MACLDSEQAEGVRGDRARPATGTRRCPMTDWIVCAGSQADPEAARGHVRFVSEADVQVVQAPRNAAARDSGLFSMQSCLCSFLMRTDRPRDRRFRASSCYNNRTPMSATLRYRPGNRLLAHYRPQLRGHTGCCGSQRSPRNAVLRERPCPTGAFRLLWDCRLCRTTQSSPVLPYRRRLSRQE